LESVYVAVLAYEIEKRGLTVVESGKYGGICPETLAGSA
jgi:hypothetical protein